MIKEILFSGKPYISLDAIKATKVIKGNNNTNRAFLFKYDGTSMKMFSGGELWGNSTTPLTIGKQVTIDGTVYDQIVACDSNPKVVGLYVYDSDLVNYNWGGKALLSHIWQAFRAFTTRKVVNA